MTTVRVDVQSVKFPRSDFSLDKAKKELADNLRPIEWKTTSKNHIAVIKRPKQFDKIRPTKLEDDKTTIMVGSKRVKKPRKRKKE